MAHKSHRKHLKHLHAHDPAKPKAKSPVEKIEVVKRRMAKPVAKRAASTAKQSPVESPKAPAKKRGIVRSIARAATKKPRNLLSKAKARVKHLLGAD